MSEASEFASGGIVPSPPRVWAEPESSSCDGLRPHRDRYSEAARHMDERIRAAFGMPPAEIGHMPPPSPRRDIFGEIIQGQVEHDG